MGCSNVLLPDFDENILNDRIKRIQNRADHEIIIMGTAGAVNVKYKNQESVIKAISKLKEEGRHVEYYMAGGG